MRYLLLRLVLGLALAGLPGTSWADSIDSASVIDLRDEGVSQGGVKKLDCTGAGVSCSRSGVVGTINVPGGVGGGYATVQDESAGLPQRPTVNFIGTGVACVDNAGATRTDCTINGGGGGSANVVEVSVDLGTAKGLFYASTVTGQSWVTGSSVIACSPFGTAADGQTVETVAVSGVQATVSDRVVGTGFTVNVYSPHGASGIYRFHCTGA